MTGLDGHAGTGRTTRTVAATVAAAARGHVYLVAATPSEVQRLSRLVREAAPDAATAHRVSVIDLRADLLEAREAPWRVRGSHAPVYADHYAIEAVRDDRSRCILRDAISIAGWPHSGLVAVYVIAAHALHAAHLRGLLADMERAEATGPDRRDAARGPAVPRPSRHDIVVTHVGAHPQGVVDAPVLIDPYAVDAYSAWRDTGAQPDPDTYGAEWWDALECADSHAE